MRHRSAPAVQLLLALLLAAVAIGCGDDQSAEEPVADEATTSEQAADDFALVVDGVELEQDLPVKLTCDGTGTSPAIEIRGVPEDTQELALVMSDPDAPGGDFFHWGVTAIDPATASIDEGSVPDGAVESASDAGGVGYAPACPPEGDGPHAYTFTLYALAEPADLEPGASPEDVNGAVAAAQIAQAKSAADYER